MAEALRCEGISKWFGESSVLRNVNLSVHTGEIHALLGENGAGKSTLMKICSGLYQPDGGSLFLEDVPVEFDSVSDAQLTGVSLIHQEPRMFPDLTVIENIWIDYRGRGGRFNIREVEDETQGYLDELGCYVNLRARIADVSVADQQLIDVASALRKDLKVLIVDEPTASLTPSEVERLFDVLRRLRDQGVAIIFIGHRLSEILEIADRMTILRDGQLVAELDSPEISEDDLAKMMVGRDITPMSARADLRSETQVVALSVENLSANRAFTDVSLTVSQGEVLGIGGLVGAGRSELCEAIFGVRPTTGGQVKVNGRLVKNARESIRAGLGLVPEDRAHKGLVLAGSVQENIVLASLKQVLRFGLRSDSAERLLAGRMTAELGVKSSSLQVAAGTLSGGNQQKLSLAKWLAHRLDVLLIDEPTRGVDVGSKAEIHSLIRQLADEGVAVVVVSSDMRELLALPDRILVMREGRLVGSMDASDATEESVISLASGVKAA